MSLTCWTRDEINESHERLEQRAAKRRESKSRDPNPAKMYEGFDKKKQIYEVELPRRPKSMFDAKSFMYYVNNELDKKKR